MVFFLEKCTTGSSQTGIVCQTALVIVVSKCVRTVDRVRVSVKDV